MSASSLLSDRFSDSRPFRSLWILLLPLLCVLSACESPPQEQQLTGQALVLLSITPRQGSWGDTLHATVIGEFMTGGTAFSLSAPGVAFRTEGIADAETLFVEIIISHDAPLGQHTLRARDGTREDELQYFEVQRGNNPPDPRPVRISPSCIRPDSITFVSIFGTNFERGTAVNISGSGVDVQRVLYISPTELECTLKASPLATGDHDLTVSIDSVKSAVIPLHVQPVLSIDLVTPAQATPGLSFGLSVSGLGIPSDASLWISESPGGARSQQVSVSAPRVQSSNLFTAQVTVAQSFQGNRIHLHLEGTDCVTGGSARSNEISLPVSSVEAPQLIDISPDSVKPEEYTTITITGANFAGSPALYLGSDNSGFSKIKLVSSTTITAEFHLSTIAMSLAKAHEISVLTVGGTSNKLPFILIFPAPTITAVTKSSAQTAFKIGTSFDVRITGTNLPFKPMVNVSGTGVTVTNIRAVTREELLATFTIDPAAVAGPRSVSVTTNGGTTGVVTVMVVE